MADRIREIRIFIASPSDCERERKIVRRLCREDPTILLISRENHVSVDPFGWEDLCSALGRPQSIINDAIEIFNPDWFVFIFWHRFGKDAGLGMTGSEEEWNLARRLNEEGNGYPTVSIFFNKKVVSPYGIDGNQLEALKGFQEKIFDEYQALACLFNGPKDFESIFRAHLTKMLLSIKVDNPLITIEKLLDEFSFTLNILLNYQRTLGNKKYIYRGELQELLQHIEGTERSSTLILGSPGSGKSSLLSELIHHLGESGTSVFVIKADTLSADINTAQDLSKDLKLSLDAKEMVLAIAGREKVVVIIDQLDAVSELSDLKSNRLNVLLDLIHNLSSHKNVHIIASSREFEYRHDIRLNSIAAETINLELPSWDQIQSLLKEAGHEPDSMSSELRELLRTPLHLKIFLDVATPGAVFQSIHALLGALWEKVVLHPQAPRGCTKLLEELATRMAQEESLWLPLLCAESNLEARRYLEQNEILVQGYNGLTIGFRHQTYYDYTLTRTFAIGSISLSDYVYERQDGLFIRPTFLNGLHYLRSTSISEYHKQLQKFFSIGLRPHLFSLLIEFLGSQKNPDDMEAHLLFPLLKSDVEGARMLNALVGSQGWFNRLLETKELETWMSRPIESASHCVPILSVALDFAGEDVLKLVEKYWLYDSNYDPLSLTVLLDCKDWNSHSEAIAEVIVNRSTLWRAGILIEQISEINPDVAPRVLHAFLEGKLNLAIQEIESTKQEKKVLSELEEQFEAFHKNDALDKLLEEPIDYINFEMIAEDSPKSFLDNIWPWFFNIINRIALKEHEFVLEYRSITAIYGRLGGDNKETVVAGLLAAVKKLAETDPKAFIEFLNANVNSDLLIVHRILAHGLLQITENEPEKVLGYILGDPRRLSVGDHWDNHRDTKRLITNIFPHLNEVNRLRLESAVISFERYRGVSPDWDLDDRRRRMEWSREHRLRLLRAIPEEYLSREGKIKKGEEERAFPGLRDHDGGVRVGTIGPRLNVEEMAQTSDKDLINLFNSLPDGTEWGRSKSEDYSRSGGSHEQAQALKELAKKDPHRVIRLFEEFEPNIHETYAGAGLEGLAESNIQPSDIICLVEYLEKKGFSSEYYREKVASALEKLAERENGLPANILTLLEQWLTENTEPEWPDLNISSDGKEKETEINKSVLFGFNNIFMLPHGRGTILRAITAGYLNQQPSDINSWANVVSNRLGKEQHPDIWAMTMMYFPMLFNGDPEEATSIYDAVIHTCPQVLEKHETIYSIARVMAKCSPINSLQEWLNIIKDLPSDFGHQVYGEMIFLYHCHYEHSWSLECITKILANRNDEKALLGLAYGASHLWNEVQNKSMAKEILCQLASHHNKSIQRAVADVFRYDSDDFQMNSDIREVIYAVLGNTPVLLEAATDLVELLIDYVPIETELVSKVCQQVIKDGGADIGNISTSLALLAEPLTNIALTLHRLPEYREVGLQMFEDLISLNVRETKSALEILDRKPMKTVPPSFRPRRRRKKGHLK